MLLTGWIRRLRLQLSQKRPARQPGHHRRDRSRCDQIEFLETRTLLSAPSISNLHLVNDTGTPGDNITSDATVGGTFEDADYSGMYYYIEVDENGDGFADGSLSGYPGGTFTYDLNSSGSLADGPVSGAFRAVEDGYGGTLYGGWQSISFTYQGAGGGGGSGVTITASASQINEGSAVTFQMQAASGGSTSGAYVEYEVLPGADPTADSSFDVDTASGAVFLDYYTGQGTLTITAFDDVIDEYDENFRVKFTSHDPYAGSADVGTFDVEILDNDNAPTVSLQRVDPSGSDKDANGNFLTATVPEHESVARFNVMFSHPTEKDISLDYGTSNGSAVGIPGQEFSTAKVDEDFELFNDREAFLSASYGGYGGPFSAGTIEVLLNNDFWHESPETFDINLTGSELNLAASSVTVTIDDNDDDTPVVSVPSAVSVIENVATGTVEIPISLSNPSLFDVTVDYFTGLSEILPSATVDQDYTAQAGPPITFPALVPATFTGDQLTMEVAVPIIDDVLWRPPISGFDPNNHPWAPEEYFAFNLQEPTNGRLFGMYGYGGNSTTDVEIIDEQSFPNLTVTPVTGANEVAEGGPIDLNFSFDQVFETTEVLNYSVYWDFDAAEHDYWEWHGGQQGPWNGNVCGIGFHWLPPTEHGEWLAEGSITLTPDGSHNFIRTVGAPPPNDLRDPYRFVRIVFSWENDDYSNGYYDPYEHTVPIMDDHLDPTLSLAVQPATIYENPDEGPNSAIGVVTLSHGWSVPHRADIQGGQSASGNSDDLEIFGPAFFEPGASVGAIHFTNRVQPIQSLPAGFFGAGILENGGSRWLE